MSPNRLFYMKHEGIHYWAMPSWADMNIVEWTKSYGKPDRKWVHNVCQDDIPKAVKLEYLLWLMQVDKH